MIPVAFFAPLKAPNHPTPSGDRTLARGLIAALQHAGFRPETVSDLRLLDIKGEEELQAKLMRDAVAAVPALIAKGRADGWRAWMTYHNYYKAPDLLGPEVSEALKIPYLQVESTRARKRLTGPWSQFAKAAEAAADQASVIFYFTARDSEALQSYAPEAQTLVHLRPFLVRTDLPQASTREGAVFSAGMMRPGDKMDSYQIIARTLHDVDSDWQLEIAGDGQGRSEVAKLMAPFQNRVQMLGKLSADEMEQVYSCARLLFWPGVNEAIGLTYLEAMATGVPVLAQDRPGLRDVLPPNHGCPTPEAGVSALAARFDELLTNPPDARMLRDHIAARHLLPAAARTLKSALDPIL